MNKVSQNDAKKYYVRVRDLLTVYVWGMNFCTIISRQTIHDAYERYKSKKYDKTYYENKLKEGEGKPGSDCSGMHYDLSGYDATAKNYYERCTEKGSFSTLPISDLVLVFKGESPSSISHTGTYIGNGMVVHMKSSKENCVYESVDKHGWTYWGKADFIDYTTKLKKMKPMLTRLIKMGDKGVDVKFAQTMLNSKGYDCGKVDGDFGKKTDAAVKKFQTACKITVDGIIGKETGKLLGFNIKYYDNPWKP